MAGENTKPDNYDYTGPARLKRLRANAKLSGGGRVESLLDAEEMAYVDRLIANGVATGRGLALKHIVRQALEAEAAGAATSPAAG